MTAAPHVAIIGTRGYPSYYGGFETAVRRLAPYLAEHGWRVTVYGRPGGISEQQDGADARVSSRVTRGLETKSLSTLSYGFTASMDARRERPDVALVMNVANGFWLPLLRQAGIPTIVNVDGIEWDRAKWGRLAKGMFHLGARLTARYADALVMDAEAIDRRWQREFGRGGHFLPYGGDIDPRRPSPLGLPAGEYALLVARFVPENSISEFFEAVPRIAADHPVILVGSSGYGGEFDERARSLAEEHASVQWLGHVADDDLLHALWQNAGAYFHGHTVGGTNPALVQAMACGAPIVARDTVYNREVLADDEQLIGGEPSAIADAVRALLSNTDRQETLRHRNTTRARDVYSWEKICAGYADALRDVIETRSRPKGAFT